MVELLCTSLYFFAMWKEKRTEPPFNCNCLRNAFLISNSSASLCLSVPAVKVRNQNFNLLTLHNFLVNFVSCRLQESFELLKLQIHFNLENAGCWRRGIFQFRCEVHTVYTASNTCWIKFGTFTLIKCTYLAIRWSYRKAHRLFLIKNNLLFLVWKQHAVLTTSCTRLMSSIRRRRNLATSSFTLVTCCS